MKCGQCGWIRKPPCKWRTGEGSSCPPSAVFFEIFDDFSTTIALGVFELLCRETSKNGTKTITEKNDMEFSHFFCKTFSTWIFFQFLFLVFLSFIC
jgi:hypothetical protein